MICQFVCEAVVGQEVSEDGKTVKITFLSGEDTVKLVVPGPDVDNLIDKLVSAREAAKAAGADRSEAFQLHIPKTFAVDAHPAQPGVVALTFDMSLPTRRGYAVASKHARVIGQKMIESARRAEHAATLAQARKPKLILPGGEHAQA